MKKTIFIALYFSFFIFHFSFAQTWLWGKEGVGFGYTGSVVADKIGNCYLSGYYYSDDTINFSDSILVNPPHNLFGLSYFLVKYNSIGNVLWTRQSINFSNGNNINGGTSATDSHNNVYVDATYQDTAEIGSHTFILPYALSYVLAKYNSAGYLRWASSPSVDSDDGVWSSSISTDNGGDVFVTGIFSADTVHFGSQLLFGNPPGHQTFLVKYDSNGNVLWARSSYWGSDLFNQAQGYSVANDGVGNSYVTGFFVDSIWFDSYQLLANTLPAFFLVKYSPNGTVLWARQGYAPSPVSQSIGSAVATDASGNIYLGGDFVDTLMLGNDTLISNLIYPSYEYSFFLAKYDSNGNMLWAKNCKVLDSNSWGLGGIVSDGNSISIDNYNHIYFSVGGGVHHCKILFGNDTISLFDTAAYDGATIAYKLDSNGNILCSSIISGGGGYNNSVSSDTSGNYVYLGGSAGTVMVFGSDTISPFKFHNNILATSYSPFIARWDVCGQVVTSANSIPKLENKVKVYPNPNNGSFTLSLSNNYQKCNVEIYNVFGENIYTATLPESQDNNINLTEQPGGIYLYRVLREAGGLVGEGKVIVEK